MDLNVCDLLLPGQRGKQGGWIPGGHGGCADVLPYLWIIYQIQ
ncbi:hypothetical protein CsSME_00020765 [Camellia sinensis var. sinensis]